MAKISVIGLCGNSVFLTVDRFHESGETLAAGACFEEIGGKGINQAVAAARMGAEVCFLTAVGADSDGEKCRAALRENGVEGTFAVREGERTAFACILTDRLGENRVTVYRGAQLQEQDVLDFEDSIAASDILLLQQEVPQAVNEKAVELAQKHGVRVILNPAPALEISPELAKKIYLATPNEHEAKIVGHLPFQNRVNTLGKDGCSVNDLLHIPAVPVTAVDTTGAGDTFNGVLAACLAEGMLLERACSYAVCASGLSVTKSGVLAAMPYRKELERMMEP